jgi:ParB family chromosome partitioning protein
MLDLATNGASVRELERLAAKSKKGKTTPPSAQIKPKFYSEVELSLKNELHRKVNITPTGDGKGKITIEFFSDEELKDFARRLAE